MVSARWRGQKKKKKRFVRLGGIEMREEDVLSVIPSLDLMIFCKCEAVVLCCRLRLKKINGVFKGLMYNCMDLWLKTIDYCDRCIETGVWGSSRNDKWNGVTLKSAHRQ